MTIMEMSALPAALFCNVKVKDVDPIYFALMVNFLIAFAVCFICRKTVLKEWRFGMRTEGLSDGLIRYGIPAFIATIVVTISFCIGLEPFDNRPTVLRVVLEGIVYYIGVGIMEELYMRGLLQNLIEKWFGERQYPGCFTIPNENLDKVISNITDVDLLGSSVYSQWRYLTHWAYTYQLDEDVCNWFAKVLQRMRDLKCSPCQGQNKSCDS